MQLYPSFFDRYLGWGWSVYPMQRGLIEGPGMLCMQADSHGGLVPGLHLNPLMNWATINPYVRYEVHGHDIHPSSRLLHRSYEADDPGMNMRCTSTVE